MKKYKHMKGDSMKKTDTKERILDGALKLFAQKGYEAVGVAEIAEEAGIKAPSLYKHYKNKRAIFDSIIERVNKMDSEKARENEMPEQDIAEDAESYKNVQVEKIKEYTKDMFLHWTEEEFSSRFRKMLALEQYKSQEMSELYQNYIAGGPVKYMADIFMEMTGSEDDALQAALEFYGPMYLLYSIYDGMPDINRVMPLLEKHIDKFLKQMEQSGEKK